MKKFSILRQPDYICGATEATPFRFEEGWQKQCPVEYSFALKGKSAEIKVFPSGSPVKHLKLRWNGDFRGIEKVLGDEWERAQLGSYIEWRSMMPSRVLPWFCYVKTGDLYSCYGVKTGADCFAFFAVDTHGVTLYLNLCNGNRGTDLKKPIVACVLTELFEETDKPFLTAKRFASMLCENGRIPKEPIFGFNNWYYAYGDISYESVIKDTDYLMELTSGVKNRPYMFIDDGWQKNREVKQGAYIGGEWLPNEKFNDMAALASDIHAKGAKAGLWMRPLLTRGDVPKDAVLGEGAGGIILDPTHPYTFEQVRADALRIKSWGFDCLKHDFTTIDITGYPQITSNQHSHELCAPERTFYDNTLTTATLIKNLYKAVQDAFGGDVIGCNTVGHLVAGIHSAQRVGGDTSGRSFEWTLRDGVNSFMRLPLNDIFYNADPDCAAFTPMTEADVNLDFLEACAITGMTTLASVTPGILTEAEKKRINSIFKIADENKSRLMIDGFENTANPDRFVSEDGKTVKEFDWTRGRGARFALRWLE